MRRVNYQVYNAMDVLQIYYFYSIYNVFACKFSYAGIADSALKLPGTDFQDVIQEHYQLEKIL